MKLSIIFLLLATTTLYFVSGHHGYYCPHDQLNLTVSYDKTVTSTHSYSTNVTKSFGRKLQSDDYRNIRIYADYTHLSPDTSPRLRTYIQSELLPAAINYYSETLKVVPLKKKLKATFDTICGYDTPDIFKTDGVDADLAILVNSGYEDSNYIAYARACVLSYINNRPNFGNVHLNLKHVVYGDEMNRQQNLIVVLHEMAHVFGISQGLFEYFINPQTGDELEGHVKQTLINGVSTYVIDVEPLTTRLRDYFNCPSIEGAILENQGPSASAASHLERRVFFDEIMTASSIENAKISEFTLAFLEGTGWYKGNYNMTEYLYWGKGKGCGFYTGPCVDMMTQLPIFEEFCSGLTEVGCSVSRRSGASCGSSRIRTSTSTPSSFNYWGNNTIVSDDFSDNCPYFDSSKVKDCENPLHSSLSQINTEVFGSESKCFMGNIGSQARPSKTNYCLKSACKQNPDSSFEMIITFGLDTVTCTQEGPITVPGYQGQIDCPDPNAFCSTYGKNYCPRGCMGRGQCVEDKCECNIGWGGADCGTKVFVDKCEKCADNPLLQSCFGDDCQCLSTDIPCLCSVGLLNCDENGNIIIEEEEQITEIDPNLPGGSTEEKGDTEIDDGDISDGDDDNSGRPGRGDSASNGNILKPLTPVLCLLILLLG